jgi:hypothetical protein
MSHIADEDPSVTYPGIIQLYLLINMFAIA